MVGIAKFDKWQTTSGLNNNSILQVVSATSGFVNQTINSTTPVALSGLSVTITPFFTTSKILILGCVQASWTYVASMHIYKTIPTPYDIIGNHGGNNQTGGSSALWTYFDQGIGLGTDSSIPFPVYYLDTVVTTKPTTYAFYANSGWSGATNNFYLNNRSGGDMLGSSYICVMEIAQ